MIDEAIKKLKSTLLTITVLFLFLGVTTVKHDQDVDAHEDAELATLIHLLYQHEPWEIEIPANADDQVTYAPNVVPNITFIEALATLNYSNPVLFGDNYCSDYAIGVPLYEWNGWSVSVDPTECEPLISVGGRYNFLNRFNDPQLADFDSLVEHDFFKRKIRLPLDHGDLFLEGRRNLTLILDEEIKRCGDLATSFVSVPDDCDVEWYGIENSIPHFKTQYNERLSSVRLLMEKGPVSRSVHFGNQGELITEPAGELFGIKNEYYFGTESRDHEAWSEWSIHFTPESVVETLKQHYEEGADRSAFNVETPLMIDWVESRSRILKTGEIVIPIVDIALPLSLILVTVSILLVGLYGWSHFLLDLISDSIGQSVSVPWMLLIWRRRAETNIDFRFQQGIAYFMMLLRWSIFVIPPLFLLFLALAFSQLSNQLLLPSIWYRVFIVLCAIVCAYIAYANISMELRFARKIKQTVQGLGD